MKIVARCPFCRVKVRLDESSEGISIPCPRCQSPFTPAREEEPLRVTPKTTANGNSAIISLEAATAAQVQRTAEPNTTADAAFPGEGDQPGAPPAWISPWGASGFILATLALLAASVLGMRWLALSFAVLGIAVVGVGILVALADPRPIDWAWLSAGGLVSVTALSLSWFAPGVLNPYGEMAAPIARSDPQLLQAVPLNQPSDPGRHLGPDEWADAAGQGIRQDDVFVRILSVHAGPVVKDVDENPLLLVQFRLGSAGNERVIVFEGFGKDKHKPTLKDSAGKSYQFLQQRKRKLPAGALVFLAADGETAKVAPARFLDFQLVFELPPENFSGLTLELPASAWGRKGACRFRIASQFEPVIPTQAKKKE